MVKIEGRWNLTVSASREFYLVLTFLLVATLRILQFLGFVGVL